MSGSRRLLAVAPHPGEDGVVRQANVSDIEFDELGAVVVACPEGDGEADLPDRDRGAVGDTEKGLVG